MIEREEIPRKFSLELPLGENEISYPELPKNIHVLSVKLRGMRNRDIALVRVPPAEIAKYAPSLRGMPTMYSLDFKARRIRFFPAAVGSFTVVVETGEVAKDAVA